MATLQEPLALNHPPPQLTSQPPSKKQRPRNAKPKLTVEQITNNHVVQSALRIGRHSRANLPKSGREPEALDNLISRMAKWANHVAPQYSLAEFVVAAQGIAGNRELRPMFGVIRLAELRDVSGDDPARKNQSNDRKEERQNQEEEMQAENGPVQADVGPEDDDWDELDIVPGEAIEVRPVSTKHDSSSTSKHDTKLLQKLSPEMEARIENNRLAAIERRKVAMATHNREKSNTEHKDKSVKMTAPKDNTEVVMETPDGDPYVSSRTEAGMEKQIIERKGYDGSKVTKDSKANQQQSHERNLLHVSLSKSGKDTDNAPRASTEADLNKLRKGLSEKEGTEIGTAKEDVFKTSEANTDVERGDLSETDAMEPSQELTEGNDNVERRDSERSDRLLVAGATDSVETGNADSPSSKEPKKAANASDNQDDEDIDMKILAEFEAGGET